MSFKEFEIQWIKNTGPKSIDQPYKIKIKLIGLKQLIFTTASGSKIRRYGLFPLIQKAEIVGCQIFIQSTKEKENQAQNKKLYKYYAYEIPRFEKKSSDFVQ